MRRTQNSVYNSFRRALTMTKRYAIWHAKYLMRQYSFRVLPKIEFPPELTSLLQGKRIVIVGPSPHLLGKNLREQIDNYDYVCRVNEVLPKDDLADYGSRTDIIFHNCSTQFIGKFGLHLKQAKKVANNLTAVICPVIKATATDRINKIKPYQPSVLRDNFQRINAYQIPFFSIGVKNYKRIYNAVGSEPNTGLMAITMLLLCNVEELCITGFSFYQQGDLSHQSYRPNYPVTSVKTGNYCHLQQPQTAFFKKLLRRYNKKITVDSYLNTVLSLNHINVFDIDNHT